LLNLLWGPGKKRKKNLYWRRGKSNGYFFQRGGGKGAPDRRQRRGKKEDQVLSNTKTPIGEKRRRCHDPDKQSAVKETVHNLKSLRENLPRKTLAGRFVREKRQGNLAAGKKVGASTGQEKGRSKTQAQIGRCPETAGLLPAKRGN